MKTACLFIGTAQRDHILALLGPDERWDCFDVWKLVTMHEKAANVD